MPQDERGPRPRGSRGRPVAMISNLEGVAPGEPVRRPSGPPDPRGAAGASCRFAVDGCATPVLADALAIPRAGSAQTIDPSLWVVNGPVNALGRDGNSLYLGGAFDQVGPATGGGVPLDATSGAFPASFPRVNGRVYTAVSDGAGGWYIGGSFTAVGGVARTNLARVASDQSVTIWNPNPDGIVTALALSGSTVYAAGYFGTIGDSARRSIAALDATTGATTSWNPETDGTVTTVAVSGGAVYLGGYFHTLGDTTRHDFTKRNNLAAVSPATGSATAWNPNVDGPVLALAFDGANVYAGGFFSTVGDTARKHLKVRHNIAAIDAAADTALAWNPDADYYVYSLAVSGSTVYAGGTFQRIGGQVRS